MLGAKQQWCPRCQRHVQTEQKQSYVGRQKELVRIIITCFQVSYNAVEQNNQRRCP